MSNPRFVKVGDLSPAVRDMLFGAGAEESTLVLVQDAENSGVIVQTPVTVPQPLDWINIKGSLPMPQADLDTVLQYFAILADKPDIPFSSDYPAFVKSVMLRDDLRKELQLLVGMEGDSQRRWALQGEDKEFDGIRAHAAKHGWQNWQDALLKFVYLCRLFGMEAK